MSKDVSDLICSLARKRTERVLGPASASADGDEDAELLQEHNMHTAGRREGCKAPSRRSGSGPSELNPASPGGGRRVRAAPAKLACGELEF